jgi:hypothetical protein
MSKAYLWTANNENGEQINGEGHTPEDCRSRAGDAENFQYFENPALKEPPVLQPSRAEEITKSESRLIDLEQLIVAWWVTQKAEYIGRGDALIRPDFVEYLGLE